jgi:hypothetical protein
MGVPEHDLEYLLGYDGRLHLLASGHYLKFEVRRVDASEQVPHGIGYSLTLHGPDGTRLLGFDNAHPVPHRGGRHVASPRAADHWHRAVADEGRPYEFSTVPQLLDDFYDEVERVLGEEGVAFEVVEDKEK